MSDTKHRYTAEGIEIRTFQPKLSPGQSRPDPMKPPPFASSKPKPAGQPGGGFQSAGPKGAQGKK